MYHIMQTSITGKKIQIKLAVLSNKTCRRTGQLAWDALFLSEAF